MQFLKVLAIFGVVLLLLGLVFAFVPATQEVWNPKSYILISKTVDVSPIIGDSEFLTYFFFNPENVRNLRVEGYVEVKSGNPISFEITNAKTYFKAEGVLKQNFTFPVEPMELINGLRLKIEPTTAEVSIYAKALWEEKTYAHVLGGLILGGLLGFFGIVILIAAFILYIIRKPKIEVTIKKEGQ